MTTAKGHLSPEVKRGRAVANSVEANEEKRKRPATAVDWDTAISRLHEFLDEPNTGTLTATTQVVS